VLQRLFVILLAVAALMLRPGTGETIENIVHLAAHGHTAHDAAHAASEHDGGHTDLEHGCAGHVHVCPCCAHPVMANASLEFALPPAPASSENLAFVGTRAGPEGAPATVFRPPIAG